MLKLYHHANTIKKMENFSMPLFLLLTFSIINVVLSEYSSEDCKAVGFNKVNLLCSSCKLFKENELNDIYDNCMECCMKDDYNTNLKRYPKAALEVCTCKYGVYPQIQAFIKSDLPKKYKNLQIRHVRGLDPIIKLYDDENKVEDVLDIHKWDTDAVDEFLDTHLIKD